jgi:hypothetical protein
MLVALSRAHARNTRVRMRVCACRYPLPSWHPPLNDMVVRRSFWSPGIIFAVMGVALLAVAYIGRLWLRESQTSYFAIPQENRVSPTEPIGKAAEKVDVESAAATSDHLHIHSARVPSRSLSMRAMDDAHRSHRAEHPMYEFERVQQHIPRSRVAKSVPTTQAHALWMRLTATRIRGTSWSTGTMLFCVVYIGLNALALLVATTYSIDRGLGSLAAANTMFLVVPAVSVRERSCFCKGPLFARRDSLRSVLCRSCVCSCLRQVT